MDRIQGTAVVDIGGGRNGFRPENLGLGQQGTVVTADWLNSVQEEVLNVILDAGLVPSSASWNQLLSAIKVKITQMQKLAWLPVISMSLTAPPGSPASGDTYLIAPAPTGAWVGKAGQITYWDGTAWQFQVPTDGHGISLPDGRIFERIGGAYIEKVAQDTQSGKWNYAVAAGTANAITATLSPVPAALVDGMPIRLRVPTTNTGACTLNLNGLGAKAIKTASGTDAAAGAVSGMISLIYSLASDVFVMSSAVAMPSTNGVGILKNDGAGALSWINAGVVAKPAAILADVRAAGTVGDALATSAWSVRQLNSDLLSSTGVFSLASNVFTPVKNCFARFKTPAYAVGRFRSRLYCTTDSAAVAYSDMGYTGNNSTVDTMTAVSGIGFCTAGKSYRIDTWAQSGGSYLGGLNNLDGASNMFSTVELFEL